MKILRAFKTELDPNNEQRTTFIRFAGTARFVYNWALNDREERFGAGEKTNYYEQKKRFNTLKFDQFPWVSETAYIVTEEAFRNLDAAYKNYFRKIKQGMTPKDAGHPEFKKRRGGLRFSMRGYVHVEMDAIKLPIIGWVRLKETGYLPDLDTVHFLKVTISSDSSEQHWFASVQCETDIPDPAPTANAPIGIDFGIKELATLSNGKVFHNPKALNKYQKKINRLNRELHRRTKGGKNRSKTKVKLAKAHAKVANIRKHTLHEISSYVTAKTKPGAIVIEDLNVDGMLKNHHLARAIADVSFGELRRQIEYKAQWNGIPVIIAPRFYASSKTCSRCGTVKKDLALADRTYVCDNCGMVMDRDLNAAKNLAALAEPGNTGGLPGELGRLRPTVNQEQSFRMELVSDGTL